MIFLIFFVEIKPHELYFQRLFVKKCAIRWWNIGLSLGMSTDELNIIQANHPNDVTDCCTVMFRKWLEIDIEATWEKFFNVIDDRTISG